MPPSLDVLNHLGGVCAQPRQQSRQPDSRSVCKRLREGMCTANVADRGKQRLDRVHRPLARVNGRLQIVRLDPVDGRL